MITTSVQKNIYIAIHKSIAAPQRALETADSSTNFLTTLELTHWHSFLSYKYTSVSLSLKKLVCSRTVYLSVLHLSFVLPGVMIPNTFTRLTPRLVAIRAQ
jgi:hypothetical protein